jgi:hypothetical protein
VFAFAASCYHILQPDAYKTKGREEEREREREREREGGRKGEGERDTSKV